eukprot:Sspe_Gene.87632::Locus_59216_Transcript_1_1_Confidence_1.000_Length_1178::g.87632::m.87632
MHKAAYALNCSFTIGEFLHSGEEQLEVLGEFRSTVSTLDEWVRTVYVHIHSKRNRSDICPCPQTHSPLLQQGEPQHLHCNPVGREGLFAHIFYCAMHGVMLH